MSAQVHDRRGEYSGGRAEYVSARHQPAARRPSSATATLTNRARQGGDGDAAARGGGGRRRGDDDAYGSPDDDDVAEDDDDGDDASLTYDDARERRISASSASAMLERWTAVYGGGGDADARAKRPATAGARPDRSARPTTKVARILQDLKLRVKMLEEQNAEEPAAGAAATAPRASPRPALDDEFAPAPRRSKAATGPPAGPGRHAAKRPQSASAKLDGKAHPRGKGKAVGGGTTKGGVVVFLG